MEKAFDEYHRFIGWFVGQFAQQEYHIRRLLLDYSGMEYSVFEALIGLPAASDALDKLVRLTKLHISDEETIAATNEAFDQLRKITQLRNWIVHFGGHDIEGGKILIRLKPTQKSRDTGESYHLFDQQQLWNACSDLQLIQNIILFRLDRSSQREWREALKASGVKTEAWRYVHPQLKNR